MIIILKRIPSLGDVIVDLTDHFFLYLVDAAVVMLVIFISTGKFSIEKRAFPFADFVAWKFSRRGRLLGFERFVP